MEEKIIFKRNYVDPSIKLINEPSKFIGLYLWMKSRKEIITNKEGYKFMMESEYDHHWFEELPIEFYVGDELVNAYDYLDRIDKMNLQYNNTEYYVFEIQGSCLFRDILYNINRVSQWATSNRFLFSILDKDQVYNSENYSISSEYEGIPEWEDQFDRYMNAIKEDPIVDHNRLEMPYSISSYFWIGIQKKTLMDLLKFLKGHAPFFYEVYGDKFLKALNFPSDCISTEGEISASITQYIDKSTNSWVEGVCNVGDTVIVDSKMGLILYSQFIRQADTTIQGLYNAIIHEDSEVFSHEVFKGNTILNVHYVADKDKVKKTISTRLCAFAMSSGNDPCSWSYFLNEFLPKDIKPNQLMDLLPCSFKGKQLVNCKFHDDIKFRNEGKELSNCPCPLVSLSMKDAETKRDRDNNRIGQAFYDLTNYIINDGLVYTFEMDAWTSKLIIKSDESIGGIVYDGIIQILDYIDNNVSTKFGSGVDPDKWLPNEYNRFTLYGDNTCMMKGLAIDKIAELLESVGYTRYLISFGGDIYAKNVDINIPIKDSRFILDMKSEFSIFTSGSDSKRGNHIVGSPNSNTTTVVVNWHGGKRNNTLVDALATKLHSNEPENYLSILGRIDSDDINEFLFDKEGNLINPTYCASPFFNEDQVKTRDKMVSRFTNAFRPDLTESSIEYEKGFQNNHLVEDVVKDNIVGIKQSEYLVFPMHTDDLGTLFEVGIALSNGVRVIRYDELSDEYHITFNNKYPLNFDESKKYLFDCSNKGEVVSLGYICERIPSENIFYSLNGCPDNIMLSVHYNHVELINGKYELIERDANERDTNGFKQVEA